MLEAMSKGPLADESSLRAALHLIRDYGDPRPLDQLRVAAASPRHEAVGGLAAAVLFDAGEQELAQSFAKPLLASRHLSSLAWGALIQSAKLRHATELATEPMVRRIQFGWSE